MPALPWPDCVPSASHTVPAFRQRSGLADKRWPFAIRPLLADDKKKRTVATGRMAVIRSDRLRTFGENVIVHVMDANTAILIAVLMGLAAALYASVGHAGASGYLAIMALFSVAPATMRPTALLLNIIVASLATFRFARAEQINWRMLLFFVIGAIPAAFIAGGFEIPGDYYRPLVGLVLWIAAARLLWPRKIASLDESKAPHPMMMVLAGAGIGALSGLTGTGGGIFLSPLILFFGWEAVRKTSGISAGFILCVSIAGLAGNLTSVGQLPPELPYFVGAVVIGALVGTQLGLSRLPAHRLLQALGFVLVIAGAKLIFS